MSNILDSDVSAGSITINKVNLDFVTPLLSSGNLPPTTIYLHHAAGNPTATQVHKMHRDKGWAGAGYHFYVHKDGSIWQLRPVQFVPAAQEGYNKHSIAISCQGNFEIETMSAVQRNGIISIVKWVLKNYPSITSIKRHKDVGSTSCPGKNYPFNDILAAVGMGASSSNPISGAVIAGVGAALPSAQDTSVWANKGTSPASREPHFYKGIPKLQKSGMDIAINYGQGRIGEKIEGVYLRSKGVVMDASGNPLYEDWEFIAKDVK